MNKTKPPEFLLCENPMRAGSRAEGGAGLYLLKTTKPLCLIEVRNMESDSPHMDLADIFKFCEYINSDGLIEDYELILLTPSRVPESKRAAYQAILDKAWRWYRAYLNFEDNITDINLHASKN